jgi:hypothetical protein
MPQAIVIREQSEDSQEDGEAVAALVKTVVDAALVDLGAMRDTEGEHLRSDLDERRRTVADLVERIAVAADPAAVAEATGLTWAAEEDPGDDAAAAVAALPALPVAAEGPLAGYDRDCGPGDGCVFGPAWTDDVDVAGGHNGCDTRNDLLTRDLRDGQVDGVPVVKRYREPGRCVVLEGVLADPYTGRTIHFTKERADAVQIDHVVALATAWRTGATAWSQQQRVDFANDPRNLLVVDGPTNQAKGDATADEWLPPNGSYHCEYARIVITVKNVYGLAVTASERTALQSVLNRCSPPAFTAPPT